MHTVAAKLDNARKELLDLSLRNPLIDFQPSQRIGIDIVDEHSDKLYEVLVKNSRFMTFLSKLGEDVIIGELPQPTYRQYTDNQLQTALTSSDLQGRLLRIHHMAKTYREENGVNILFLALGMLHWIEGGILILNARHH